jgi:hypothetical protein
MQTNKVHELTPPTCVLYLSKKFWSSHIPQCCSLFIYCPCPNQLLLSPCAFTYLCSNFSPFVINFHKRCSSYWYKGLHWGRWLTLESCIFYGHYQICWNDTCIVLEIPYIGSLTWYQSMGHIPYVIAWVIHLINLSSCMWENLLHLMIT